MGQPNPWTTSIMETVGPGALRPSEGLSGPLAAGSRLPTAVAETRSWNAAGTTK